MNDNFKKESGVININGQEIEVHSGDYVKSTDGQLYEIAYLCNVISMDLKPTTLIIVKWENGQERRMVPEDIAKIISLDKEVLRMKDPDMEIKQYNMARSVFRTVLVIGDNHEEIIKKYSADTAVKPYVKYRRDDAAGMLEKHISIIKEILENPHMTLTERQREVYKDLYLDLKSMDDFDYYLQISDGCIYDEENGDAISTVNPNAYYRSEACYEKRFQATGEEAPFSNPFKLKNGKQSYSARLSDIDWEKNHMFNTEIYRAAWELVVEDRDPQNEREEHIKNNMSNRLAYFQNFTDVDE